MEGLLRQGICTQAARQWPDVLDDDNILAALLGIRTMTL
jgi:hypothetical protein